MGTVRWTAAGGDPPTVEPYFAFATLPERMHAVQTRTVLWTPSTMA